MDEVLSVKVIHYLQNRLNVNDYTFKGVHLWPAFRIKLFTIFQSQYSDDLETSQSYRRLRRTVDAAYGEIVREVTQPWPDRPGADFTPTDRLVPGTHRKNVLILSNAVDYGTGSGQAFESSIIDPWLDRLRERASCLTVELLHPKVLEKFPRRQPTVILPAPLAQDYQRALDGIWASDLDPVYALCADAAGILAEDLRIPVENLAPEFERYIATTYAHKLVWDGFNDSHCPDAAFMIGFYHEAGLGFTWSCRERDIPVVDFQHGIIMPGHQAYTHWSTIPPEGYRMLPTVFLSWGAWSANNIARWLPRNGHPHRVLIGGRHDLSGEFASADEVEREQALRSTIAGYRRVVCVTLGYAMPATGVDERLQAIIEAAPKDWMWLIRCHPMIGTDDARGRTPADIYHTFVPDGIEALLRGRGIVNFKVALPTALRLATVLRHADHHVTAVSSTVSEALTFGVPTTFTCPLARHFYGDLIDRRQAHCADDVEAVVDSIERGWNGLVRSDPADQITCDPAWRDAFIERLA